MVSKEIGTDKTNWIPLIIVLPGTFITFLNISLLNVALPELKNYFDVSSLEVQWIITAFTATLTVIMPITGYLIAIKGSKTIYSWSLLLFLVGSSIALVSNSLNGLILSRIVQGIGAGLMGPVSMTIIYQTIPLEKRGVAMGFLGLASMAAPAIGPVAGGYLLEHLTWPYLFALNLPIILPALWLGHRHLIHKESREIDKFDFIGFITLTFALLIILWGFNYSNNNPTTYKLIWLGGFLSLAYFIVHELRTPHPLLDLYLLRYRNFLLGNIIASLVNFGLFAGVILIPLYTQEVLGYTPLETGLVMGPAALLLALSQPLGGWLLDRFDPRLPITIGLVLVTISTWYLSKITVYTSYQYLLHWQLIRGLGLGLAFAVATSALNDIPNNKTARGASLFNTLRQLSGTLGAIIITIFLNWSQNRNVVTLSAHNLIEAKALAASESFLLICLITAVTLPVTLFLVNHKNTDKPTKEPISTKGRGNVFSKG